MDRHTKRRLVELSTTQRQEPTPAVTSTPESATHNQRLIERLGLLNKSVDTDAVRLLGREAEPAEDPTAAFFRKLGNPVRSDKAVKQPACDNVHCSPLPVPVDLVEKLMNAYGDKGYEIAAKTNKKLDDACRDMEAQVEAMAASDRAFIAEMGKSQKWAEYSLCNSAVPAGGTGGVGSGRGTRSSAAKVGTLGGAAIALRAKCEAIQQEVADLLHQWESLDDQISRACDGLAAAGNPDGGSALLSDGGDIANIAGELGDQVNREIAAADMELKYLADAAIKRVEQAEQNMKDQFRKEKGRILEDASRAMDLYCSDSFRRR